MRSTKRRDTRDTGTKTKKTDSWFVSRLADQARRDEIAAPWHIDSLCRLLEDYLAPNQVESVRRAHAYAESAHAGQRRMTGHPYISHPLAVAAILADMRMDHQTLMAALLHDVIEDTSVAKTTLGNRFGKAVAELVDGVSKLSTIFHSRAEAQAVNFQKMTLAMAKDIRVIMVKIADRLHNMRTIGVLAQEQRRNIARETLDYYAPIANRLGMRNIKVELEDLAFAALYPLRADRIGRAVATARGRGRALVKEIHASLETALANDRITARVSSREKHLYSIYKKMKLQHKSFREIMDVFGFRIVVEEEDACYRTLGVVHNLYKPVAGRFKDYVSIPKINGYQSLHTTVFGMHGVPMEVQIRTRHMDEVADHGIAGHWLYKAPKEKTRGSQRAHRWVQEVVELQQRSGNPLEFIDSFRTDLFPDDVYVFTPKGRILELPKGASPIDFAYAVHTDVGNNCIACRIDRVLAPLSQQLQSGQSVEIITREDGCPSPDWLNFAVTSKARSSIRHALKKRQRAESIRLGRKLLNRSLAHADTRINDLDFRRLRRVFKEFGVRRLNEMLEAIGIGELMPYVVAQKLLAVDNPNFRGVPIEHDGPVAIRTGEGLVISCSRCCGPVPGDPIIGHMTPGKGFVVHMAGCRNLSKIKRQNPEQVIPARWTRTTDGEFLTPLRIDINRRKGVIAALAAGVASVDAGVDEIHVTERNAELSTVSVVVGVNNRTHLARVMRKLRTLSHVQAMARGGA